MATATRSHGAPAGDDVTTREGTVDLPATGPVPVLTLDGGATAIRALRNVITPRDAGDAKAAA